MIHAPQDTVEAWAREVCAAGEVVVALSSPQLLAALHRCPQEVAEALVLLSESVSRMIATLTAAVVAATPGAPSAFRDELSALVGQALAEHGREPTACPLPTADGGPFWCQCGPESRALCEVLNGEAPYAGDDGCEGGTGHPDLNSDPR